MITRLILIYIFIFFCELLEERQGTFNRLRLDAVGRAEVARAAEIRARYEQQVVLLGALTERIVVFFERFGNR